MRAAGNKMRAGQEQEVLKNETAAAACSFSNGSSGLLDLWLSFRAILETGVVRLSCGFRLGGILDGGGGGGLH